MKQIFCLAIVVAIFFARHAWAQVLVSGGTYAQNFDALANSGAANWTNNFTLPGWYASKASADATNFTLGTGSSTAGGIYSFSANGVNSSADHALGSVGASSTTYAYGVRFTNDTAGTLTNITVSYTGEQWRSGSTATPQMLAFSYQVSSIPLTNSYAAAGWTSLAALNFISPNLSASSAALDGNAASNRATFTNIVLLGVAVAPSQEFFLRWTDVDDAGFDNALAIDDLSVNFQFVTNTPPPTNNLPLVFSTNSSVTLMTYNTKGNGVTDWSTNAAQVQAIGRQLLYLRPDIITFNEIPRTNVWQMANWVAAFMPGYFLATNSGNDGFINCVIASRFPINRSKSWLDGANLNPFGYTNTTSSSADNYTRDLFEAEINVPNWSLPLHVFTTHLKSSSGGYTEAAAKRAAEAAAITNFLATNFFALYPTHPFTLSGDMNESDTNTLALQRLISAPTTLRLTNPTNPFSGSINTYSIQASLSERIDFIFASVLLASNITASQVFRTDLLTNFSSNLFSNDDKVASDHLPVLTTFANPFNTPYKFTSFTRTNQSVTLKWESATNRFYAVEASTNLLQWTALATNLFATGTNYTFATNNVPEPLKFFRIYRVP